MFMARTVVRVFIFPVLFIFFLLLCVLCSALVANKLYCLYNVSKSGQSNLTTAT